MTTKSVLLIATLALSTLAVARPKTYDIRLIDPARAGNNQLTAGAYRLQVVGSDAIFTNLDTHQAFVAPVKVTATRKHEVTAVETQQDAGKSRITSIDLRDSDETLQFGE